jgi:hypothetical protein
MVLRIIFYTETQRNNPTLTLPENGEGTGVCKLFPKTGRELGSVDILGHNTPCPYG